MSTLYRCIKLSEVDPQGVKQRVVSLRDMIKNRQIVLIMASQTSQVKQVSQCMFSSGSTMVFGNNLVYLGYIVHLSEDAVYLQQF